MVCAQLAERSLSTQENPGSNQVIGHFYWKLSYCLESSIERKMSREFVNKNAFVQMFLDICRHRANVVSPSFARKTISRFFR